jgi:hypothetical protein
MTQGGGGASAQAVSRCSPQRLLVGINPEMIMQARNMPLSLFFFFGWTPWLLGLCVKFLKGHPHIAQVPCFRGSLFLLDVLYFILGDSPLWEKIHRLWSQVHLRSSCSFTAVTRVMDKLLVTLSFSFVFYELRGNPDLILLHCRVVERQWKWKVLRKLYNIIHVLGIVSVISFLN